MHTRRLCQALLIAVFVLNVTVALAKTWSEEQEAEIGREAAAQIEKEAKIWDNPEALKRVEAIVTAIAPKTDRPEVKYKVKLLDEKDVNAYTIPGGYIYVYKGLIEDAQSDDELAGVLAHEIAHNCTYDALEQSVRSQKLFVGGIAAALLAVVFGADNDEITGVLAAGSYVRAGVLSRYSLDLEEQADKNAVRFLSTTQYNPVGLLTFMERLAAQEWSKPQIDYGIYQDHPLSNQRVSYLIEEIYKYGLDINRRAVTKWEPPKCEVLKPEGAQEGAKVDPKTAPNQISLWGEPIFTVTNPGNAGSNDARAKAITENLQTALATGLERFDVRISTAGDSAQVLLFGKPMLTISATDVQGKDETPEDVANDVRRAVSRALHKEELTRRFDYGK